MMHIQHYLRQCGQGVFRLAARCSQDGLPALRTMQRWAAAFAERATTWLPAGGEALVEQVIHLVDLMRYLMGDPVTVYARQENIFHRETPGYTVEDVSATVYSFAGGGLGVIYATNGAIPNQWVNDYRVVAQNITAWPWRPRKRPRNGARSIWHEALIDA